MILGRKKLCPRDGEQTGGGGVSPISHEALTLAFLPSLWHSEQNMGVGAGLSSATSQPCDLEKILLSGPYSFHVY